MDLSIFHRLWRKKAKPPKRKPELPNDISLLYHSVGGVPTNPLVSGKLHNVRTEVFHDQLKGLMGSGYRFVPLEEFVERSAKGEVAKGMATISFDDGYSNILDEALPVLKDLQIPSTFFIVSDLIEGKGFWRDKVRLIVQKGLEEEFLSFASQRGSGLEGVRVGSFYKASKDPDIIASDRVDALISGFFQEKGIELDEEQKEVYVKTDRLRDASSYLAIGNHTASHYMLSSLSQEKQCKEIMEGERKLKEKGFEVSSVFSIPFGGEHTYNFETLEILEELGYKGCALSSASKLQRTSGGSFSRTGLTPIKRCMPKDNPFFPFGLS